MFSIGNLVKTLNPIKGARNSLKNNYLLSASKAGALKEDMVQRTLNQFQEYNDEELFAGYTRPTLDLHIGQKFWGFMTKGMNENELADMHRAREQLEDYEKLYNLMEYMDQLNDTMNNLESRIRTGNPTNFLSIYRSSEHNQVENVVEEVELIVKAYYDLLDACTDSPAWKYKIEMELGQNICYLLANIEEGDEHPIFETSPYFKRFDEDKQIFFK